jgi:hypothetical protein
VSAPVRKVFTAEVAKLTGVKPATVRGWKCDGRPRAEPLPAPDGWHELWTPWWLPSTILPWIERRAARLAAEQQAEATRRR